MRFLPLTRRSLQDPSLPRWAMLASVAGHGRAAVGDYGRCTRDGVGDNHASSGDCAPPTAVALGLGWRGNPGRCDAFALASVAAGPVGKPAPSNSVSGELGRGEQIAGHSPRSGALPCRFSLRLSV